MATYPSGQVDNIDQSGLTISAWPGTLGSSDVQPIVIDQQIRGGLRFCAGGSIEKLTEIRPQRLENGMLVYLKTGYTDSGTTRVGDKYYKYYTSSTRNTTTGELPNAESNWTLFDPGTSSGTSFSFPTSQVMETTNTTAATSVSAGGALIVAGGARITGALYTGGVVGLVNTTDSTSNTSGALVVSGGVGVAKNLNVGLNVTAYATSDRNLKENIVNISDALNKIKNINGVEFDWKKLDGEEDGYFNRKHDIGVIAQEIESVLPEAVGTRSDGTKAVRYEKIIPLLIEAIKEQANNIDQLKQLINNSN